jgi:hypothetical protein
VSSDLLVLPSPLLGQACYEPFADSLRRRGHAAEVADCPAPIRPDRLTAEWIRASERADVLIAHSNAGYLAPGVSAAVGGVPVLFMDAALPPDEGSTRLAPADLLDVLETLADADGRLPQWTRWWSADQMSQLLPGEWYPRIDSVAPRLDLAYFETEIAAPQDWTSGPCGYLAFGATYADEVAFARQVGWSVLELDGHHLWHLARPDEVTEAVDHLLGRMLG